MPRPRPPYLNRERTRHGTVVWYVRMGDGPRIRIRGEYGSPEFMAAYRAAVNGEAPEKPAKGGVGTLEWLVERYRETSYWSDLSRATRRQRENIFKRVLKGAGSRPYSEISAEDIIAVRDMLKDTPAQARHFIETLRGLFRWAVHEARLMRADPTAGVSQPKKTGLGFPAWTEDDIAAYQAHWPQGTRQRVWFDVLLHTGLRRGDAVQLGRQHVKGGVAQIKTEKSGYQVEVFIPISPALQATLDAGPTGDLAFICGLRGEPLTKETFGNMFRTACRAAGIGKSAHGIRKAAATLAAEEGATEPELMAMYGWADFKMAAHYTRAASRKRLSMSFHARRNTR